jgi:hypothetical protein
MAKRKPEAIIFHISGLDAVKRFVQLLNTEDYWSASLIEGRRKIGGDYRPIQKELRRLVQAWFRSGPNVQKLLGANPMLDQEARKFRPHFIPTKGRTAALAFLVTPEYSSTADPLEIALAHFLAFLLNPHNEKLGGPCKHCGRYYLKNTKRQNVYCTQRCGLKQSSQNAIDKSRKREYEKKLLKAKLSMEEWAAMKTTKDWKVWVSGRAFISKNWLTRAVKKGELVEPAQKVQKTKREIDYLIDDCASSK